jgi:hypothetical protein
MWFKYALHYLAKSNINKNPINFVPQHAREIFNQLRLRDKRIIVQHTIPPEAICSIFSYIMPEHIKSKFKQNIFTRDNPQNNQEFTEEIKNIILDNQDQLNKMLSNKKIMHLLSANLVQSREARERALNQCFFSTNIVATKFYIKSDIQLIFSIPIIFFAETQIMLFGDQFYDYLKKKYNYYNETRNFEQMVEFINLDEEIEKIEETIYERLKEIGEKEITIINAIDMRYLLGISVNQEFIYLNPHCNNVNYNEIFYKPYVEDDEDGDGYLNSGFSVNNKIRISDNELIDVINDTKKDRDKERIYFSNISPNIAYQYALYVDRGIHVITKREVCKDPYCAYWYARDVEKPLKQLSDEIRKVVCQDPKIALEYAKNIELPLKQLSNEIRNAVCQDPKIAWEYAKNIELPLKQLSNEIRNAVCKNPYYAYYYARDVELPLGQFSDEIRNTVCQDPKIALEYAKNIELPLKQLSNEIRNVVCKNPYYAYYYARDVELPLGQFSDEIRNAVCHNSECALQYALAIEKPSRKLSDEIRKAVCKNPSHAFKYTIDVEKPLRKLSDEIRNAVCQDSKIALEYAKNIELPLKKLSNEIRNAVCKEPFHALEYAIDVELPLGQFSDEIRNAVCKNRSSAWQYAVNIELPLKQLSAEIRNAVCKEPFYAYVYARDVELPLGQFSDEIRNAIYQDDYLKLQYEIEILNSPAKSNPNCEGNPIHS